MECFSLISDKKYLDNFNCVIYVLFKVNMSQLQYIISFKHKKDLVYFDFLEYSFDLVISNYLIIYRDLHLRILCCINYIIHIKFKVVNFKIINIFTDDGLNFINYLEVNYFNLIDDLIINN